MNNNQFTFPLPPGLGKLTKLREFLLHNNNFNGTIPVASFEGLRLTVLYLQANQLSGAIPESIGNLTSLIHLDLHSNQLTGAVPDSIANLRNLVYLRLSSNQLIGPLPSSIGKKNKLTEFRISNNKVNGTLPNFENLTAMHTLGISSNFFVGTVSNNFSSIFCVGGRMEPGCNRFSWSGIPDFQPISGVSDVSISNLRVSENISLIASWKVPINLIVTPTSYYISANDRINMFGYSINNISTTSISLTLPNSCNLYNISVQVKRNNVLTPPTSTLVSPISAYTEDQTELVTLM